MTKFEDLVYDAVRQIPKGKVATYKSIALFLGNAGFARAIGNALHKNTHPEEIFCFRVVNCKGKCAKGFAFGGALMQLELLKKDGVCFKNEGTIDLNKSLYTFK